MKKSTKVTKAAPEAKHVLVLRTSDKDGKGYGGFQWPTSGTVEAPDWNPSKDIQCGHGLHGLLAGIGNNSYLSRDPLAKWIVVKVLASDVVPSDGKVRFPRGEVVYYGRMPGAYQFIHAELMEQIRNAPKAIDGNYANAATSGNYAHAATSGDSANAATSGDYAHAATSGNYANAATSGNYANAATSGYYANAATSGNYAHAATSGDSANAATSGDYAHAATSGNYAHAATSGACCVAAAVGRHVQVQAGPNGCIVAGWWDKANKRPRVTVGYVGEAGIKAATWYKADEDNGGALVEVK